LGNDYGYEKVFERQVESLVNMNDVVIGISTSGKSENVLKGIDAARNKGAKTIALTGKGGGDLREIVDLLIDIPSNETPRIQEMHILVGHVMSNIVENSLR
jgi:D-sedoheptulose 7-phosphate isomerase